jgi:hypothetical protein
VGKLAGACVATARRAVLSLDLGFDLDIGTPAPGIHDSKSPRASGDNVPFWLVAKAFRPFGAGAPGLLFKCAVIVRVPAEGPGKSMAAHVLVDVEPIDKAYRQHAPVLVLSPGGSMAFDLFAVD